jgi:cephalosporin hydroxylase
MSRFEQIIAKYSAYGNEQGTDKITVHSYGPIYEQLFASINSIKPITILEIGIFSGAFLQVLAEYFTNAQEVIGIDITFDRIKYPVQEPIRIYEMDGTQPKTAEVLGRRYDLIIEDASHIPDHQIRTLEIFSDYLNPGGVYVIEDIADENMRSVLQKVADEKGLTMEWNDLRNVKNRFDDIIAVFRCP